MLLRIGLLQILLTAQRGGGTVGTHEHPSFQDGTSVKAEILLNRRKDQTFRYLATHAPPGLATTAPEPSPWRRLGKGAAATCAAIRDEATASELSSPSGR